MAGGSAGFGMLRLGLEMRGYLNGWGVGWDSDVMVWQSLQMVTEDGYDWGFD